MQISRWFAAAVLLGGFAMQCCRLTAADDAEKVRLCYRFEPGQTLQYEDQLADRYEIQFGSDTDKPYTLQSSRKSIYVASVEPDGSAVLELRLDAVSVELNENDQTVRYDSSAGGEPPEKLAGIREMLGRPRLQVTVTPAGKVTGVRNLLRPDQEIEESHNAAQDVLTLLPTEPVAVGESWKEDFEVPIRMANSQLKKICKMQRRYTLKSLSGGRAEIALKTISLTPIEAPDEQLQLIRRTPSGTIVLDVNRGVLIRRVTTQDNQVVGVGGKAGAVRFEQRHEEQLLDTRSAGNLDGTR